MTQLLLLSDPKTLIFSQPFPLLVSSSLMFPDVSRLLWLTDFLRLVTRCRCHLPLFLSPKNRALLSESLFPFTRVALTHVLFLFPSLPCPARRHLRTVGSISTRAALKTERRDKRQILIRRGTKMEMSRG